MVKQEEDDEFEDIIESAEYSSKSDLSKAEKVAKQIEKCNENRSKEMKEGYNNYDKIGNKIQVPDSRKEWISSVTALKLLLRPEIIEKKFKQSKFDDDEKALIILWGVSVNGEKRIPLLDEKFPEDYKSVNKSGYSTGAKQTKEVKGKYNSNFHRYWDDMVKLYDELYAQLNVLIHECNYFKQEVSY